MTLPSFRTALAVTAIVLIGGGLGLIAMNSEFASVAGAPRVDEAKALAKIPFDGKRAYDHLKSICEIGPRISGSEGMLKQRELVSRHFETLGAKVSEQAFEVRHPQSGERVRLANLLVEWHPERRDRILLCAHYDTRPFPDQDPDPAKRTAPFIGANDGASGVALLMELGAHMPDLKGNVGVDFVLFDAEEFVFDPQRDRYFLGSEEFARTYVATPPKHKYRAGILFDLVADAELQIYYEKASMRYARPVVQSFWETAARLRVAEFIARPRHDVRDDHLPLNEIAKIPTIDVIDFDYPRPGALNYWHTTRDVPENCSALSLAKVGWVTLEWLKKQR